MSSEKFDSKFIFKKGQIEMHDPHIQREANFRRNREQAAALTRMRNTRKALEDNFLRISPLYRTNFPQKGFVQVMLPTSIYAYGGVMVVAAGKALFSNTGRESPDDIIKTETAFDLEEGIRKEYFRQILACIQAEEDTLLPRKDYNTLVVAYENNMADISTTTHRLPRTISLPHSHVIKSGDWFNESELPIKPCGFKLETKFLQNERLFKRFLQTWRRFFQDNGFAVPEVRMRIEAPFGYTILCPVNHSDPLQEQAEYISALLMNHHKMYGDFVSLEINRVNIKRKLHKKDKTFSNVFSLQPSYRTYIYYDNNMLRVTISPMLLSSVGALQAMDAGIHRSYDHAKLFSDDELDDFFSRFTNKLTEKLSE